MDLTLIGISCLLVLALFLSTIDGAFHYFSKITIRQYSEEGWKTEFLDRCLEDPMRLLLPLRIGIQGGLIAVTVLLTQFYIDRSPAQALVLAFLTMVPVYLIFREVLPNFIARISPERVLLALLPAFRIYDALIWPISRPLSHLVRAFVQDEEETEDEGVSEEEVQAFIETGEEEGILEGDEGRMVRSIVDLGDKVVREIMTPRPEMVGVRREANLAELRQLFMDEKYSRVPVFEENLDHIVGLVHAIDVVSYADRSAEEPIDSLIRPVKFVPETKKVSDLLREFQRSRSTIAMVVDEYGGTSGLLTVEDIIEEIVGEIHDEFDEEVGEEFVREGEGVFLVSGRADVDLLKEKLGLDVNGKGFDTVSGLVLAALGRVPQSGEAIDYQGLTIEVVDAEGQRINKVRIRLRQKGTA
ncbi:MAG: hemolysin family protein [Vicinamibacteria bacterium]